MYTFICSYYPDLITANCKTSNGIKTSHFYFKYPNKEIANEINIVQDHFTTEQTNKIAKTGLSTMNTNRQFTSMQKRYARSVTFQTTLFEPTNRFHLVHQIQFYNN